MAVSNLVYAELVARNSALEMALGAALLSVKPISDKTEMRQGDDCTEIVQVKVWPDWVEDARRLLPDIAA